MENDSGRGMVIVYTGDGKGKTTAALGLSLRAAGHGNRVHIIQFVKSDWPYGEREGIKRLAPEVTLQILGAGCIGIMGDDKPIGVHRKAAREAMEAARGAIDSGKYELIILDEINVAAHLGLIDVEEVLALIKERPTELDLVLTGRNADERIIAAADLVTEMKEIKHPYRMGRTAKKGIDF